MVHDGQSNEPFQWTKIFFFIVISPFFTCFGGFLDDKMRNLNNQAEKALPLQPVLINKKEVLWLDTFQTIHVK